MKIIVDIAKKKEVIKIDEETFLFVLNDKFPLLSYKKFLKLTGVSEKDTYYLTKNANGKIKNKLSGITSFSEIKTSEIFLKNMKNIIKNISTGEKMNICIYAYKKDSRIFELISYVSDFCSVIYLVTDDENFYEDVTDYSLENHGIAINLKQFGEIRNTPVNIILNSKKDDFSEFGGCIINLSDIELKANKILCDISPLNFKEKSKINIEKCCFLEKDCQNFNLIWKNSQKVVDKSEK